MTDEESWDEDEQRRINENKNWKASDGPLAAWDIDKERDAVMYRKESLRKRCYAWNMYRQRKSLFSKKKPIVLKKKPIVSKKRLILHCLTFPLPN